MGLSLLLPSSINTLSKKQLLVYHDYGDHFFETLFKRNLLLNQKTGTVVPILRFARDRP